MKWTRFPREGARTVTSIVMNVLSPERKEAVVVDTGTKLYIGRNFSDAVAGSIKSRGEVRWRWPNGETGKRPWASTLISPKAAKEIRSYFRKTTITFLSEQDV